MERSAHVVPIGEGELQVQRRVDRVANVELEEPLGRGDRQRAGRVVVQLRGRAGTREQENRREHWRRQADTRQGQQAWQALAGLETASRTSAKSQH